MSVHVVIFGLALAFGLGLTCLARGAARRLRVLDPPDGFRKLQKQPVPVMGGAAIFGAFFASLLAAGCLCREDLLDYTLHSASFQSLAAASTAVLLIGLWDDVRRLRARWKLLLLTLVSLGMCASGYRIEAVGNPFGSPIHLGFWSVPLTVFWFVACMNAVNLVDGLDGLASGVGLFASGTLFLTSLLLGNSSAAALAAALAGAALGFLFFNFPPASIYLGDSGSYLLGLLIASVGVRGSQKSSTVVALLIPIIALGLPVMDTTLAITRRWARGLPWSLADRQHIHHKLLSAGFSHRQAVLMMYAVCFLLAGLALLMTAARNLQAAGLLLVLGAGSFVTIRAMGRTEIKLAKQRFINYLKERQCRIEARVAGYEAAQRMRQAESLSAIWDVFAGVARKMDLDGVNLAIRFPWNELKDNTHTFVWSRDGNGSNADAPAALWFATLPLVWDGVTMGKVEVTKITNGRPFSPEIPAMLEVLGNAMASNIARLHSRWSVPAPSARAKTLRGRRRLQEDPVTPAGLL